MDTSILATFPFFKGLKENELEALYHYLKEESFPAGTNIITEGDTGDTMYVLTDGTVDIIKSTIYGDQFVCATLTSQIHAVFGEMAMIDKDKRSATVYAKTDCKALSISSKDFNTYLKEYPSAGVVLLTYISKSLVGKLRSENDNLKLVYQALLEEIEAK